MTRRTRFVVWLVLFAALAAAAPHLPVAWGIALAIVLFVGAAFLPASDCPVRPSDTDRSR